MLGVLEPYFVPLGYVFGFFGKLSEMSLRTVIQGLATSGIVVPNLFTSSTFTLPAYVPFVRAVVGSLNSGGFFGKVLAGPVSVVFSVFSGIMYVVYNFLPSFILDMPLIIGLVFVVCWFVLAVKLVKLIFSFIPFFH